MNRTVLRKRIILIVVLVFAIAWIQAALPAAAATCTWTGAVSGDWEDTGNWSNCAGALPGGTDTAVIPNSGVVLANVSTAVSTLTIQSGGEVALANGVTLDAANVDLAGTLSGTGTLQVATDMQWQMGSAMRDAGETVIAGSGSLDLAGYVDLVARTLRIEGVMNWTGNSTISASSGASLVNNGTVNAVAGSIYNLVWQDALNNTSITNNNTFDITGVGSGTGLVLNTSFQNDGVVDLHTGLLRMSYGSTNSGFIQDDGASFLLLGGSSVPGQAFTFTGSSKIDVWYVSIESTGTVDVNGIYDVAGSGSKTSMAGQIGGSSVLNFHPAATVYGLGERLAISAGTVNLSTGETQTVPEVTHTGTLTGTSDLIVTNLYSWSAGTVRGSGTLTVSNGAILRIWSNVNKYLVDRPITNDGTIEWRNDGNIIGSGGAVITNNGLFDVQGDADFTGGADATLVNHGELVKSAGTLTSTIGVAFQNYGTVNELSGTLAFTYGNLVIPPGGVSNLGGGTLNPGSVLVIDGGTLSGDGTVAGDVWNGGTVSPGQSPGHITVQGNFTQTVTGTLSLEIAGDTSYDRLTILGSADLSGTLAVTLTGGYLPNIGDTIQVMTYTARSGSFATVVLPPLPGGHPWDVQMQPDGLYLHVPEEAIAGLTAVNDGPTALGIDTTLTASLTAGSNVNFAWDFGDGNSGSGMVVTHTYPAAGTYTAVITASNGLGAMVASTEVTVDEPILNLQAFSSGHPVFGEAVTLTATIDAGTHVSYTWDFGDDFAATGMVVTHTYGFPGTYTATVTAVNNVSMEIATVGVVVAPLQTGYAIYLPVVMRP